MEKKNERKKPVKNQKLQSQQTGPGIILESAPPRNRRYFAFLLKLNESRETSVNCFYVFSSLFFSRFFLLLHLIQVYPAVHLITTVYTTVVRTRECVCLREAGGVTAALTD